MKKSTKTKASNLHANDMVGSFSPFHTCEPSRDLLDNDADLDKVSAEIMDLLKEVH